MPPADVFCREGFAGASIDEIAGEACVSRQTIYNHYREKETLFMAVVEDVMDARQCHAVLDPLDLSRTSRQSGGRS